MAKSKPKKAKTNAKSKAKTNAKPKSKPKPKPKSKAKPKINSKSKSQGKAKTAKPKKQVAAKKVAKSAGKVKSNKKASSNLQAKPKSPSASKASDVRKTSTESSVAGVFTPLDDRVMIERAGVADRTPGGLYIPDTVADRPNRGKVIAVGRGHRDKKGRVRPLDVEKGDEVLFSAFAGSEITISNREFLILREDEIIAVVK